jgi:hypothetical protein
MNRDWGLKVDSLRERAGRVILEQPVLNPAGCGAAAAAESHARTWRDLLLAQATARQRELATRRGARLDAQSYAADSSSRKTHLLSLAGGALGLALA